MLRYGWPALILALGIVACTILEPPGPDGIVDQSVYGLSAEALAQGRWWTLVSHAFLPVPVGGVVWLGAAFVILALTPMATANRGWLGGWRTPAVFIAAAGVGAVAQLSMTASATVSGPWAGVAGLTVYLIASRRLARVFIPPHEPQSAAASDTSPARSEAKGETSIHLLTGSICLALQMSFVPGEIFSPTGRLVAGVVIAGLGVLAFVGLNTGGSPRLKRIGARLGELLLLAVFVTGVAISLRGTDFGSLSSTVIALPWICYLAGATVGLIAGLVERRRASAR